MSMEHQSISNLVIKDMHIVEDGTKCLNEDDVNANNIIINSDSWKQVVIFKKKLLLLLF